MTEHVRALMTVGSAGVVLHPVASFRWQRRKVSDAEPVVSIEGRKNVPQRETVLQQAWVDNLGHVEWRDVPIVDAE